MIPGISGGWAKLCSLSGRFRPVARQPALVGQARLRSRCKPPIHSSKQAGTSWRRRRTAPTTFGGFSTARTIRDCGENFPIDDCLLIIPLPCPATKSIPYTTRQDSLYRTHGRPVFEGTNRQSDSRRMNSQNQTATSCCCERPWPRTTTRRFATAPCRAVTRPYRRHRTRGSRSTAQ